MQHVHAHAHPQLEPGAIPLPVQPAPPGLAAMSQEEHSAAEFTHCGCYCCSYVVSIRRRNTSEYIYILVCTTFADCVEALPPSITRSVSDLRELDAVLSGSLGTITEKLNALLCMLEDGQATKPQERLVLLKEIAEEARSFRLGGEDKIRVATGTCETVRMGSRCTCLGLCTDAAAAFSPFQSDFLWSIYLY